MSPYDSFGRTEMLSLILRYSETMRERHANQQARPKIARDKVANIETAPAQGSEEKRVQISKFKDKIARMVLKVHPLTIRKRLRPYSSISERYWFIRIGMPEELLKVPPGGLAEKWKRYPASGCNLIAFLMRFHQKK
ncbi:MAG: hypothetical protein R3335_03925 [Anaerolineales bacterium]|nr:hypothetical protein [Anaerolineales bacterium]